MTSMSLLYIAKYKHIHIMTTGAIKKKTTTTTFLVLFFLSVDLLLKTTTKNVAAQSCTVLELAAWTVSGHVTWLGR